MTILIASSSLDEESWRSVEQDLLRRGLDVLVYEADRVASGSVDLTYTVSNDNSLNMVYNGRQINLESIQAAWFRRPTMFSGELADKSRQLSLDTERRLLQYPIWEAVPCRAWLSEPRKISHAENKIIQLSVAREVGFRIPMTVVSNDWQSIESLLPSSVVFKPSYGTLYTNDGIRLLYTTPLTNSPSGLPKSGNPFPGLWQPFLEKLKEWRVTVVGDDFFAAAIYTDADAKDDWRRHQLSTSKVRFAVERLPAAVESACRRYLERLQLGFGAFDLVESPDGHITFLECNANGQFGWLEDELGLPISRAIADQLSQLTGA